MQSDSVGRGGQQWTTAAWLLVHIRRTTLQPQTQCRLLDTSEEDMQLSTEHGGRVLMIMVMITKENSDIHM